MKDLHIIYVPGFGDHYDVIRRPLFNCWRLYGVTTEFIAMNWKSAESYADKLARIHSAVDQAKNRQIVLIGESAGGSTVMAVHATRYHELRQTMTISGKNHHAKTVAPRFYRQYIAFRDAMYAADIAAANLNHEALQKFISFYPLFDGVVSKEDAYIPKIRLIRILSIGHLFTILLALTVFSGYIVHTARQSMMSNKT